MEINNEYAVIFTKNGIAKKVMLDDFRPMGRMAIGIKAIELKDGDEVVSVITTNTDQNG